MPGPHSSLNPHEATPLTLPFQRPPRYGMLPLMTQVAPTRTQPTTYFAPAKVNLGLSVRGLRACGADTVETR